jgi:hypothetical protein
MIKLSENLLPVNTKSTKDLTKPPENKGLATEGRTDLRKTHLLVESFRKKHDLTKKQLCILINNVSLYYSREEKKRNDTIIGVPIGRIAAMSGCRSKRTVDEALKDTRFYRVESGKDSHNTNKITLQRQAFSLFQELSTILGDKAVGYFKAYYKKLRTYIPKGIIYNIYHKNFVLKNYIVELEIEKIVCKDLDIPKKTFRHCLSKFDFVKAGNKFSKTILESVINWIKKLIRLGKIKTTTQKREDYLIKKIEQFEFDEEEYNNIRIETNCDNMHPHIERAKVFILENKLFYKDLKKALHDISIKLGTRYIRRYG